MNACSRLRKYIHHHCLGASDLVLTPPDLSAKITDRNVSQARTRFFCASNIGVAPARRTDRCDDREFPKILGLDVQDLE